MVLHFKIHPSLSPRDMWSMQETYPRSRPPVPATVGWVEIRDHMEPGGWDHIQLKISNCKCIEIKIWMYIFYMFTQCIYIYTITLPIFICGFHAVLTQALPRQVHWPKSPKKMVFSLDDTAPKNNPFHLLLLTVVTCQFGRGRGGKSHRQKAHRASPVGFSTAQEPWHQKKSEDPLIGGSTMTEEKKTQKYCWWKNPCIS